MRPKKTPKRVAKKAELTPPAAQAPDAPPLTADERRLVAEALRRAEDARDAVEDAVAGFGRWLLVHVFDDDAAAALGGRRDNAVWRDLLARAGGPTLRMSERMLYVALHIAAYDKRITDESWRRLESGRKEILLPLSDEAALREAAQHVTAMKLTQRATRAYVRAHLAARNAEGTRRVTAPQLAARVRRFREQVADRGFQRRAVAVLRESDGRDVEPVRQELEALRAWATGMLAKLR